MYPLGVLYQGSGTIQNEWSHWFHCSVMQWASSWLSYLEVNNKKLNKVREEFWNAALADTEEEGSIIGS
jgi:hypothetical protein